MRPGVSWGVLGYPWVSWGILGCPGVIRPTRRVASPGNIPFLFFLKCGNLITGTERHDE